MKDFITIIKSNFLSIVNLFLLFLGGVLILLSSLINQLYIPLICAIPLIAIGLITSSVGSIFITIIIIIIGSFIFLILMSFIQKLVVASSAISSFGLEASKKIFSGYYYLYEIIESDMGLTLLTTEIPRFICYILLLPCYIVKIMHYIIIYIYRYMFIPAICTAIGIVVFAFYFYRLDFKEGIAFELIDKLSYFSTHTAWGDITSVIIITLALIGTIIKFSFDLKTFIEYIYVGEY